ncbi:IS66 family transposase zinc-finger binding domain-containing protein [Clostridium butyricum]|uniref:IS66 family transposase zinc-finger binding domain-containing protein n=2 Tax=Clostridiaceae TaxID=31979 RepID=UPI001F55C22C|nr:IS66 family transposase zinc-finger binding domain-containing protein [Clostridium butyricum]
MTFIGIQTKELLKFKPAEIYIEEHRTEVWACKNCEAEADISFYMINSFICNRNNSFLITFSSNS